MTHERQQAQEVPVATRHVMQANKSKNTKPELKVRRALRKAGLPGYRLHWKAASGRPDICYPGRKVAIFVHGCFWHRCPYCALPDPKTNVDFWEAKFARNRARDARNRAELARQGWTVLVVWECRLKKGRFEATMEQVVREVRGAGKDRPSGRLDLCWPGGGRVVEIGTAPAWRRGFFAQRPCMRHSGRQLSGHMRSTGLMRRRR